MERYDFYFQVVTGAVLIFCACLTAMGVSSPTIVNGKVQPGNPLWASFLALIGVLPGIYICAFAYWRAKRRPNNLAWVFTYGAGYFWLVLKAVKQQPEPDDPTFSSLILVMVALAVIAALFFLYDRFYAKSFASDSTIQGRAFGIQNLAFLGRLFIFVICLGIALSVTYLKVFQSETVTLTAFIIVLLLGCMVSGLISEQTAGTFFPWMKK